jgi:hypothetical protein
VRLYGTMPRNSTEGMDITDNLTNTLHIEKFATPGVEAGETAVPVFRPAPYIRVRDQNVEINHGAALIDEAFSDGPGWAVIYNEEYPSYSSEPFNGPIGYTHLDNGLNKNVKVTLNIALVTARLYAVLYKDEGQEDTFEYPGSDYPLDLHAENIYPFNSQWPHPSDDFRIDWQEHMSGPGPDWM